MIDTSDLGILESDLLKAIDAAADLMALEEVRIAALGKKGTVSQQMQRLGKLAPEERKAFGQSVNVVKTRVSEALEARKATLEEAALEERLATETADITLPVRLGPLAEGRVHPVSQVMDELAEIFADLGFSVAEGPDIETDDYNFTKLNIPEEHPSRQDHDTFYFKPDDDGSRLVLRTHTSPVQIRTMLNTKPPIRIIAPGRVYRCDSDQTHTPMFHQVEGLVIDENVSFANLKAVLHQFVEAFFERKAELRFRPSYFPFTEPSAEVDVTWGEGKWLEILGCGMVHPNVLESAGVDADRYTGYAFGIGIERLAMLRYGVTDLRTFFENDLRFLRQFR
jgi:phenylalanyl-tRNA synthetase alpha chain